MPKTGTRCYCVKQKGHKVSTQTSPFSPIFRGQIYRGVWLVRSMNSTDAASVPTHGYPGRWSLSDARHSSEEPQTGAREQPTLQAEAWQLNFNILSHFPGGISVLSDGEMHSELEEVRCSESAVHRAKGFYVTSHQNAVPGTGRPTAASKARQKQFFLWCAHISEFIITLRTPQNLHKLITLLSRF